MTRGPREVPWQRAAPMRRPSRLRSVDGRAGVKPSQMVQAMKPSTPSIPPIPVSMLM